MIDRTITLKQIRNMVGVYEVTQLINTTLYAIGNRLDEQKVKTLISRGFKIIIK